MANVLTLTSPLMRQTVGFDRFNDLFESLVQGTEERLIPTPLITSRNLEKTSTAS